MATRAKAAGYHGCEGVKFAPKETEGYGTPVALPYAKGINPSALLDAVEQYADNRLLFRIPRDKGYEWEFSTTAPDAEFEKMAGFAMEGANGLIRTNVAAYVRGALYYEFIERDADGKPSKVKVWMYEVEVGKGSETYSTDTENIELGTYAYPFRAYGTPVMDNEGTDEYLDDNGMGRTAYMYVARPSDTGYATFGDTVPVPKLAASGG